MKKEELIKHSTAITVASIFLCIPCLVISQESVSYTQMQADSGQRIYAQRCANCHGFNLEGFELAPALAGNLFTRRFGDGSADNLARNVLRMPPNEVGLSEEETAEVLAYLFSRNGVEVGTTPVSASLEVCLLYTSPRPRD